MNVQLMDDQLVYAMAAVSARGQKAFAGGSPAYASGLPRLRRRQDPVFGTGPSRTRELRRRAT
jgi:hypothetical protein